MATEQYLTRNALDEGKFLKWMHASTLTLANWPITLLRQLGQFRPQVFIFYWPNRPPPFQIISANYVPSDKWLYFVFDDDMTKHSMAVFFGMGCLHFITERAISYTMTQITSSVCITTFQCTSYCTPHLILNMCVISMHNCGLGVLTWNAVVY